MHKQRDYGFFREDLLFSFNKASSAKQLQNVQDRDLAKPIVLCRSDDFASGKDFLFKILSAVGLEEENVNLLLYKDSDRFSVSELMNCNKTQQVLIFGDPRGLLGENIDWAFYAMFNFELGQVLCAHTLGELSQSSKFKGLLWKELKVMFDVA